MPRFLRAVSLVSGLTLATNLLGFVREVLIGRQFGTGAEADSFVAAFTIVSVCFLIFTSGAVQSAFMPAFQQLTAAHDPARAAWLFRYSLMWLLAVLFVLVLLLQIGAPQWTAAVVPGFPQPQRELTEELVRLMAPMIILAGAGNLFQSVVHSQSRFFLPALAPALSNAVIIAALLFWIPRAGIRGLALANTAGSLFWWILLLPAVWFILRTRTTLQDRRAFSTMIANFGPLLILVVADQLTALILRGLASGLGTGSIAALNYAARLVGLPVGILSASIATVYFPALSDSMGRSDAADTRRRFQQGLAGLVYVSLPTTALACLKSEAIVRVFFQRGAFGTSSVQMTASALAWYSLGILPQGLIVYLGRVYYAARNTRVPMWIGLCSAFFHVVFCWLMRGPLKLAGIALGTTMYAVLYAAILVGCLGRVAPACRGNPFIFWRPLVASAAMAALLAFLPSADWRGLMFGAAAGGLAYVGILLLCRDPVLRAIVRIREN